MNNENDTGNSLAITQSIIRYAQALNADATLYFGTNDTNLANEGRKAMLVADLKLLKAQIDIIDGLLVNP